MLKLKTILSLQKINKESDWYVPIKLRFSEGINAFSPSHCWSLGLRKPSFLEIGFEEKSGIIYYLTVVTATKRQLTTFTEIIQPKKIKYGLPAFATPEKWAEKYYIEDTNDFEIQIKDNNVRLVFDHFKPKLAVKTENVTFYFNKNKKLFAIEINDMSKEEMTILNEYFAEEEKQPYLYNPKI